MSGPEPLLDGKIFHLINGSLSNPLFDRIMPFVTDNAPLLLLPAVVFLLYRDRRETLLAVVLSLSALALSDWLSETLKQVFQRPRPFLTLRDAIVLVGRGGSYSMPSGHATNVFSVGTVLAYTVLRASPRGWLSRAVSAYILLVALSVSFSRVYTGVHYPSDVLAGGGLGLSVGVLVILSYRWTERSYRVAPHRTVLGVALVVLGLFRIYYILNGPLELSPDEAHYWDWSRRLDLSYYSKGPVIAYIIALGTGLLGDTEIGVRAAAVVFSGLSSVVLYLLVRDIVGMNGTDPRTAELAGLVSAMLIQVVPLFAAFAVVMTIDSPFVLLWALSLYIFHLAVKDPPGRPWLWPLLGVTVGVGLMTKYTMAFFYLSAFLYLMTDGRRRRLLLQPGPWVAFLVSLLCFSPVLIWNAGNDWVTFRHAAGQAHLSEGLRFTPERFIEFVGSQLGVITPVVFLLMVQGLFAARRGLGGGRLLFWFTIPTFVFFLLKSLQGKVQANWALPAYIAGLSSTGIYLAGGWGSFRRPKKALVAAGLLTAAAVTAVAHYPLILNLSPDMDPTSRLRGWRALGREVSRMAEGMEEPYFLFSDRYQVTSELAFYVKGRPRTYCINLGRRMNQYDLWPGFHDLTGYNAIFVRTGDGPLPERMEGLFGRCEKTPFAVLEEGRVLRRYGIFRCYGFRGMEREPAERF